MAVIPLRASFVPDAIFNVLLPSRIIVGQPLCVLTSESKISDRNDLRNTSVNSLTVDRRVQAAA